MGSEWINAKLGDICNINMGQSPKSETYNENREGLPFYQGRTDFGDRKPKVTKYCSRPIKIAEKGEVLLSVRAPVGDVNIANSQCCIGRGIAALSLIKGDNRFLYYLLKANKTRWDNYSSGTVFPAISKDDIKNFEVYIPSNLYEQQKIASILSAFDDKIELNNEMNKTLEEIAQAIFKHWFIDFEFPNENGEPYKSSGGEFVDSELGPIPKGWKVIKISEICEIQIGGDWGKDDKFEGAVPVYCLRGVDLQKLKENGYSNELPLRWVKKSSLEKRMLSSEDILIAGSGVGPVGRTLYFHENIASLYEYPLVYSNFCKRIKAKSEKYAIYIEQVLENMYTKGEMTLYINGTSVPNLNINGLIEHKVVLPTDDILNKYADFKSKVLARKYSKENLTLSQLRDTLLPKLISGEIRVM